MKNYENHELSPEVLQLTFSEPVRLALGAVVTKQDTQDISLQY